MRKGKEKEKEVVPHLEAGRGLGGRSLGTPEKRGGGGGEVGGEEGGEEKEDGKHTSLNHCRL